MRGHVVVLQDLEAVGVVQKAGGERHGLGAQDRPVVVREVEVPGGLPICVAHAIGAVAGHVAEVVFCLVGLGAPAVLHDPRAVTGRRGCFGGGRVDVGLSVLVLGENVAAVCVDHPVAVPIRRPCQYVMREVGCQVVVVIADDAHGMGAAFRLEGVLGPRVMIDVPRVGRLAGLCLVCRIRYGDTAAVHQLLLHGGDTRVVELGLVLVVPVLGQHVPVLHRENGVKRAV